MAINYFILIVKKIGEVDFLINDYSESNINAIEVKSGKNQNNFRAILKLIKDPYNINKGYVLGNKNIVRKEKN